MRDGLLAVFEQEVTSLCGEPYCPTESAYRRAGSERVTIQTTSGKELISKRRVREMLSNGLEREVKLNSYSEVKRRKGMFDEVLESICHGASGNGVGKLLGVSAGTVCEGWKARSKELLDEFRGRDLLEVEEVALMVDGIFPGKDRCVVELGWTPERFGKYEREDDLLRGRQNVDVERWRRERIGKKYQWIALHEMLGYLSDHYRMLPEWGGEETTFAGPWQFWAPDFDPSQPLRDLEDSTDDEMEEPPPASPPWWREVYPDPFADAALCANPNAWVRKPPADFRPLIEWPSVPGATGDHLVLGGYYTWNEPPPLGSLQPRPGRLKVWCHIRAWLVRREHFATTHDAVRQIQFWGEGCHTIELDDRWLGAYPWGEEFADLQEYCAQADRWVRDETMPIEQSIVRWGGDDLSGFLPSPRLLELLGAHWSGYDFEFIDAGGKLVAFSPYTGRGEGSGPFFVHKASLIAALRTAGWELIWAVVGDQSCYDHVRSTHVTDAEMQFSAVYWIDGDALAGGLTRTDILTIPRRA